MENKVTPRYEISKQILFDNYQLMKERLPGFDIFYALKANAEICVLETLRDCDSNFECASIGEYERLRELGIDNDRIICGLPIKTEEIITYFVEKGCNYFVFDDMRELEKLERLAKNATKVLRMYICDLAPNCIEFGMRMNTIQKNIKENQLLERIDGISFHITNNINIENELKALGRAEEIVEQINWNEKKSFILNIGGSYNLENTEDYFIELNKRIHELQSKYNLKLMVEPGTGIVNSATNFFTKVIMVKENDGFTDVYLDGGMPSGIMLEPKNVRVMGNKDVSGRKKIYRFMDTTCLHRQLFIRRFKEQIEENDMIEFVGFGSYSICFRNDFHLWDKPEVIFIE